MKSIKDKIKIELVINKSTFINYLIPINSLEDMNHNLAILKDKYSDASHHCFAYIIGNNQEIQKYSDDGEPSKTAGYPMMEVLKKHNLTNVLNVSIRYFGGIKLGAGGLVRAYTKGCANCVALAKFTKLAHYSQVLVTIPFNQIGNVEKYLRDNYTLINISYDTNVSYTVDILTNNLLLFKSIIMNNTNGDAKLKIIKEFEKYE